MADLAASDVSVSLPARDRQIARGDKVISLADLTFGDGAKTYPTGGVPLPAIGNFGVKKAFQAMFIQQPSGNGYTYRFDQANHKIKIMEIGQISQEEKADAGSAYTVTHDATPDGNAIYMKYDDGGNPYLCCNMANDEADKAIAFAGGQNVVISHDASAGTGGLQVYFDEDGVAAAQLLVNNTLTGGDVYLPTDQPDTFLKVVHDASAATNGVAITYDDGTDERIEATFAGTADVDLSLSAFVAADGGALTEIQATATPAEVTLTVLLIGE